MQLMCARGTCQVGPPSRVQPNAKAPEKASDGSAMLLGACLDVHIILNNQRARVKAV